MEIKKKLLAIFFCHITYMLLGLLELHQYRCEWEQILLRGLGFKSPLETIDIKTAYHSYALG